MISDRLAHLQTEVEAYYEQLAGKEKARRLAPQEEKARLQQQIREVSKDLESVEHEYWARWRSEMELVQLPDTEAKKVMSVILTEVESLASIPTVQSNSQLMDLLWKVKAELTKPGFSGTGKLKAVIPLLPGFLSYELELDTEGFLRRIFPAFRQLSKHVKK